MNKVSVIQGQISQNTSASILRNGAIVSGRVISKDGNNTYLVSIAGQKICVKSEVNLLPGSVFNARVTVTRNLLQLSLVKENPPSQTFVQKILPHTDVTPQIADFLSSIGLEPSQESLRIFQFMQQIGMKINISSAKKALSASKDKSGVNQEKAQIRLLLDEKGIVNDESAVEEIRDGGHNQSGEESRQKNNREQRNAQSENVVQIKETIKKFFEEVDEAALERKAGILAAFNTITSSGKMTKPLRQWLVFPFEWDFENSFGNIKLLFDSDLKKLEKVIIDLKNEEKRTIFVLGYDNEKISSLRFSSSQEFSDYQIKLMSEKLSSMLEVSASYESLDSLCGFCAGDEELSFVSGRV